MRPLRSALLAVALAVASRPALAAPPVTILELATDDLDDQAKALTKALKTRLRAMPDKALADADLSVSVLALSLKCGDVPDAACQLKIADKIKSDVYVWGSLRKQGASDMLADVRLFTRGQPEVRQQVTLPANLKDQNDPAVKHAADDILMRLFNPGKVGAARVVAKAATQGELFVDGKSSGSIGGAPLELTLTTGDHHFEVRSGDKILGKADAKILPNGTVEVVLAAPGEGASGAAGGVGGAVHGDELAGPKNWKRTAGYAGVAAGGVMIGAGLFSMLKVNSINNDEGFSTYRKGFKRDDDVCAKADQGVNSPAPGAASPSDAADKCSAGKTFQTLQYVFLGLGVVTAGAGGYLLMTSKRETGRVMVVPSVGKQQTGIDVTVRF